MAVDACGSLPPERAAQPCSLDADHDALIATRGLAGGARLEIAVAPHGLWPFKT